MNLPKQQNKGLSLKLNMLIDDDMSEEEKEQERLSAHGYFETLNGEENITRVFTEIYQFIKEDQQFSSLDELNECLSDLFYEIIPLEETVITAFTEVLKSNFKERKAETHLNAGTYSPYELLLAIIFSDKPKALKGLIFSKI